MNPEEKEILKETLELAEENNKILRKLQSAARWGRIFRILYWLVIIGFAVGVYYYFQPFLDQFFAVYEGAQGVLDSFSEITDTQ